MNELLQSIDELRQMSAAELAHVADDGLRMRLRGQAEETRAKHGSLGPGNLDTVLNDRRAIRYPVRLVLEYGEMGLHQFAQPEPDIRTPGRIMLYIRPVLGSKPDLVALAVSYFIPVINYGAIIEDSHCLTYGAALMNQAEASYYQSICDLANAAGARTQYAPASETTSPPTNLGCSCSCKGDPLESAAGY